MHEPQKGQQKKVRTYRRKARKDFLAVSKTGRPSVKKIRKGIKKQIQYVARNLGHIEKLAGSCEEPGNSPLKLLNRQLHKKLLVAAEVYRQQKTMFKQQKHSIADRIVSISQPHVRPIVRGKARADVEFGAKISLSMVDGYAFLEKLSWDAYNEALDLKDHIEAYRERFGSYPASVHVDKIYRNRENLKYCKKRGIALSGPPLGRPPKDPERHRELLKGARESEVARIPIEGKFGNGKRRYGWNRISSKLRTTSESSISLTVLVMNLEKIARDLLLSFLNRLLQLLILVEKGPDYTLRWWISGYSASPI